MSIFGWLPAFEGEETLFSWAAKINLASGSSAHRTSIKLFGSVRAARMHSALSGLNHLCEVTEGLLGTPRELISTRTSLAGYLPYMCQATQDAIVQAFTDGKCSDGDLRLGHRASKLPGPQFLRYCATCAAADKMKLGYSRWLIVHQLPAVWTCPFHAEELIELPGTTTVWQLPGDHELRPEYRISGDFPDVLAKLTAISCAAYRLGLVRSDFLRDKAIERCCSVGLVSNPRRLSASKVTDVFRKTRVGAWAVHYKPLHLLATREDWIVSLLRGRTADHPIKWAIVWAFLWECATTEEMLEAFHLAATGQLTPSANTQFDLWPQSENLAMKPCIERVQSALMQFDSLKKAALALGITYDVLSRWISENPQLKHDWLARLHNDRRQLAIERINEYIAANPQADRQKIINACNTDIRWLQRNDATAAMGVITSLARQRRQAGTLFSRLQLRR